MGGGVLCAAYSPDGAKIVTGSEDHTARLWDAATGEQTGDPLWHERAVVRAIFSADGNRILTASLDGKEGAFLVENEIWWRAFGLVSVGSEIRVSRNVYATDGRLLLYPTLGIRYLF